MHHTAYEQAMGEPSEAKTTENHVLRSSYPQVGPLSNQVGW